MAYERVLGIASSWAAILTAIVATWGYGRYLLASCNKRWRIERYLKREKEKGTDKGQRSVLHLVANLNMAEGDVLDAAFGSKHVHCVVIPDEAGRVASLLFEYVENSSC